MSVRLDTVIAAACSREASLPAELCGYLVLAAVDGLAGVSCSVGPEAVTLDADGRVLVARGAPVEDTIAEESLRRLLRSLLGAARSSRPAVRRVTERPAGDGTAALAAELEAALIPVNRAAAKRAMARLYRETARAVAAGIVASEPERCDASGTANACEKEPFPSTRRPEPPGPKPTIADPAQETTVSAPPSWIDVEPVRPEEGRRQFADPRPRVVMAGEPGTRTGGDPVSGASATDTAACESTNRSVGSSAAVSRKLALSSAPDDPGWTPPLGSCAHVLAVGQTSSAAAPVPHHFDDRVSSTFAAAQRAGHPRESQPGDEETHVLRRPLGRSTAGQVGSGQVDAISRAGWVHSSDPGDSQDGRHVPPEPGGATCQGPPRRSDLGTLVERFGPRDSSSAQELCLELQRLAGLDVGESHAEPATDRTRGRSANRRG